MRGLALLFVRFYQRTLSPYTGGACRYLPTCSQYSYEAISKFGVLKGTWLTARRLARCHPLGKGGLDPTP